jgi:CRISPR system Cascade subunit CasD
MDVLLLRLEGPLMSFGGPMVDQNGVIADFPPRSMLAGLAGNALGWCHHDTRHLQSLQDAICLAARLDRRGERLTDYQTVDLGSSWMQPSEAGWTTRHAVAERGGANAEKTHRRYRDYLVDAICTVAFAVRGADSPDVGTIARAIDQPRRPLFLGRKACLPTARLSLGVRKASSVLEALAVAPPAMRSDGNVLEATWDIGMPEEGLAAAARDVWVYDERRWSMHVHAGRRRMRRGTLLLRQEET